MILLNYERIIIFSFDLFVLVHKLNKGVDFLSRNKTYLNLRTSNIHLSQKDIKLILIQAIKLVLQILFLLESLAQIIN